VTRAVVILSAPSGGGKTTIAQRLLRERPADLGYSVSATTRPPRPGEQDGQAYHFLSRAEFERRRAAGEFLECAEYAGHLYGTLRSEVERVLNSGRHVVMDIEIEGARQVRAAYPWPRSISVFILPPSRTWRRACGAPWRKWAPPRSSIIESSTIGSTTRCGRSGRSLTAGAPARA